MIVQEPPPLLQAAVGQVERHGQWEIIDGVWNRVGNREDAILLEGVAHGRRRLEAVWAGALGVEFMAVLQHDPLDEVVMDGIALNMVFLGYPPLHVDPVLVEGKHIALVGLRAANQGGCAANDVNAAQLVAEVEQAAAVRAEIVALDHGVQGRLVLQAVAVDVQTGGAVEADDIAAHGLTILQHADQVVVGPRPTEQGDAGPGVPKRAGAIGSNADLVADDRVVDRHVVFWLVTAEIAAEQLYSVAAVGGNQVGQAFIETANPVATTVAGQEDPADQVAWARDHPAGVGAQGAAFDTVVMTADQRNAVFEMTDVQPADEAAVAAGGQVQAVAGFGPVALKGNAVGRPFGNIHQANPAVARLG